ncbi:hypothetical protein Tco_0906840 [Tanacetum coccineum]|uniref:Uncharacterized protein n=1 Tax=Tanacetum coccineum TaxID=301880 RepID=A0ABQ5CHL7_9ASTR
MREISRREGVNREGNVSKRRNYLSPSNKSVKTDAEEFLEKASRELLGDNKSSGKGPFKLQDSDEDDDMSAEPIMSGCIKVSVINCIPAGNGYSLKDKYQAKTDKTERENEKSVKSQSQPVKIKVKVKVKVKKSKLKTKPNTKKS